VIRAVLVDDEPPARVRMRQLLDAVGDVSVVGEAGNADEARVVIRDTRPDLLFLDVEMPEVRGTALAASLPEPRPFIVFATAFDHYALDAIALDATDYLLKPVSRAKLAATLDRVRARLTTRTDARDIVAATAVQSHMWPGSLPRIAGFDCAAASLPARGVGGDFYDAVLAGDHLAFVLGDVAGKGMAAGLIASSVQARWQAALHQRDLTLTGMMAALNQDVFHSTEGSRYATLVHGVLSPATGRLRYVNAGHPPSLIVAADGSWREALAATAPAIGLFEGATFPAADVVLAPGDTLIVVSDGVSEALDPKGCEFDLGGVAGLVAEGAGDAATLPAAVVEAVCRHRGADQAQDDVTVLSLWRRP